MQETILLLRQQLNSLSDNSSCNLQQIDDAGAPTFKTCSEQLLQNKIEEGKGFGSYEENCADENTPTSVMSLNRIYSLDDYKECSNDWKNQVHMQVTPFFFLLGIFCIGSQYAIFVLTYYLVEY
jgi:hypothetical protein